MEYRPSNPYIPPDEPGDELRCSVHYEDFECALDEFATYKRQLEDAYDESTNRSSLAKLLEAKKRELWDAHTENNTGEKL